MKTRSAFTSLLLLICVILSAARTNAQAPSWLWASNAGAVSYDEAYSVACDENGNSYVAGYYNIHIFDLPQSNGPDAFIANYDPAGNVTWATAISDTGRERIYSICLDKRGHYYVLGTFDGNSLHICDSIFTKSTSSSNDIFLAKFDTMHHCIWAAHIEGTLDDYPTGMAVDSAGFCYITGWFNSAALDFGNLKVTNTSQNFAEIFVAKYDPNGNALWARSAQGASGGADKPYSIAIDGQGSCYITGDFNSSTLVFDTIHLNKLSNINMFIAKYSTDGTVLYARRANCTGDSHGYALAVDPQSNCYLAGAFKNTITLGDTVLTSSGNADIFLTKMAPESTVLWATSAGGNNLDAAVALTTDKQGYCYMTGYFNSDSIHFDTWNLVNNTSGFQDILLSVYSPTGQVEWAKSIGGNHNDYPNAISVDPSRKITIAGTLGSTAMTVGDTTLESFGTVDVLVARSGNSLPSGIQVVGHSTGLTLYPNPAHDQFNLPLNQDATIEILDVKGSVCRKFNALRGSTIVNTVGLMPGFYFVRTIDRRGVSLQKLLID
jgi:hypothetical protein